jgi:hypothetical protein
MFMRVNSKSHQVRPPFEVAGPRAPQSIGPEVHKCLARPFRLAFGQRGNTLRAYGCAAAGRSIRLPLSAQIPGVFMRGDRDNRSRNRGDDGDFQRNERRPVAAAAVSSV